MKTAINNQGQEEGAWGVRCDVRWDMAGEARAH